LVLDFVFGEEDLEVPKEASLANLDFSLAALFLWITFFLAVLSMIFAAADNVFTLGLFLVFLTVFFSLDLRESFFCSRLASCLSFFLACFVTGMHAF
jgi:hypothetical protein